MVVRRREKRQETSGRGIARRAKRSCETRPDGAPICTESSRNDARREGDGKADCAHISPLARENPESSRALGIGRCGSGVGSRRTPHRRRPIAATTIIAPNVFEIRRRSDSPVRPVLARSIVPMPLFTSGSDWRVRPTFSARRLPSPILLQLAHDQRHHPSRGHAQRLREQLVDQPVDHHPPPALHGFVSRACHGRGR